MVQYNLSHLTQSNNQEVSGPIQDDEALFLFGLIRGCLIKTVLEIGGLSGYSATNFLEAVGIEGTVFTCDRNPVAPIASNHLVFHKDARDLTFEEFNVKSLDLVFFDCHELVQLDIYKKLVEEKLIDDETIIVLHDTNLHFSSQNNPGGPYHEDEEGWEHQPVERQMANIFKDDGYDIFSIRTTKARHVNNIPFRHGVTICQKFKRM